jgi:predicted secreted hydrolase
MSKYRQVPYKERNHGTFEEEWLCHRKTSEWWYATGYCYNENKKMYSFQFTMIKLYLFRLTPFILMCAVTDIEADKHYYNQRFSITDGKIVMSPDVVAFGDTAKLTKGNRSMRLEMHTDKFAADMELDYGKGAFWHCDNGHLMMGVDKPNQSTYYYSYTNMPAKGTITLDGKTQNVQGKCWFDKEGGPYNLMSIETQWEWFSLRFFDDEEMMLFSFPQDNYQDGTFITKDARSQRLQKYTVTPKKFVTVEGMKFSAEWHLSVPGLKEEEYDIIPFTSGQLNLTYFELLAKVVNKQGKQVGVCFVELLPGAYNKKRPSISTLFRKR